MEEIKNKFDRIHEAWNTYFLASKFCQSKINFTPEIKTNFASEIYHYFNDTIPFLINPKYVDTFHESVFQAIGILQIIYTQQDLIDELLPIFKLGKVAKNDLDKKLNRDIRNLLIGHPIRRDARNGNELVSSVFYGSMFCNGNINYIIYSKENNYKGEVVFHNIDKIILRHSNLLNKYLDEISKIIHAALSDFKNSLFDFHLLLSRNVEFEEIIKTTDERLTKSLNSSFLFKEEILKKCIIKRSMHMRYQNAIAVFLDGLGESISWTIDNLEEFLSQPKTQKNKSWEHITPSIVEISTKSNTFVNGKDLHYEFSKLAEKDNLFGIRYFKEKFTDDTVVYEELINMGQNLDSDLEFYSSLEYLRKLFVDRNFLHH